MGKNIELLHLLTITILLSNRSAELEEMIKELEKKGESAKLKISVQKAKILTNWEQCDGKD